MVWIVLLLGCAALYLLCHIRRLERETGDIKGWCDDFGLDRTRRIRNHLRSLFVPKTHLRGK